MGGLLAVALMVVGAAAVSSLLLALPVMVAAESLVGRKPPVARRFWHVAAALPLICGVLLAALALLSLGGDIAASPHQDRIRPHLCLLLFTRLPDAAFRFHLYALVALGLLVFAGLRLLFSAAVSSRAARVLADAREPDDGAAPVVELATADPFCFTVGAWRPVVVSSTGLRALLSPAEHAAVLAHERAHVCRRDGLAELLLRLATDPLLWVPTTHYYLHNARLARERCCDLVAAEVTSVEDVASALGKLAALGEARHQEQAGDLAGLRPTFPDHANPSGRLEALSEPSQPSLAPSLPVILGIELTVLALGVAWQRVPLHDTLHCLASSLLRVLR